MAAGPGSFTGLRVGIATMQGLAFSRELRIVPVSTLEALATHAGAIAPAPALIAPWVDAQRGEVFAMLGEASPPRVLVEPSALTPERTLEMWQPHLASRVVAFAGDGAVRYRDIADTALAGRAQFIAPPALAAVIGRIAAAEPGRAVLPHAVAPVYVRRPDAELARDRGTTR